jgi:uncharacterized membrane protein
MPANRRVGVKIHPPATSFAGVFAVDCYYHNSVPSVATCADCRQTICATCRDAEGICPGCRLQRRIAHASAASAGSIPGGVGPSNPPPPQPPPSRSAPPPPQYGAARVIVQTSSPLAEVSPETRALLGLGYPLWPLALLALIDSKRSPAVRRQAVQSLALNGGMFGLFTAMTVLAHFWIVISWPAWVMLPFLFPVWLVATVVYGFKVWQGDDVRVPLVSDWLDEHERSHEDARVTA